MVLVMVNYVKVVPDLPKNVFYLDQDTIILDNILDKPVQTLWSCPTSYGLSSRARSNAILPDFKRMKNNNCRSIVDAIIFKIRRI